MAYAQVEKGDTFLMGMGDRGELSYASGLYRATTDLDLASLHAEYMADDQPLPRKREVVLLMGDEEVYLYNRHEAHFQEWLLERGHVERVPCKLLILTSEIVDRPDGSGPENVINSSVEDPFLEETESHSFSP